MSLQKLPTFMVDGLDEKLNSLESLENSVNSNTTDIENLENTVNNNTTNITDLGDRVTVIENGAGEDVDAWQIKSKAIGNTTTATDLNTITTPGFYHSNDNLNLFTNLPANFNNVFKLIVESSSDSTSNIVQTIKPVTSAGATYQRTNYSGTWDTWYCIQAPQTANFAGDLRDYITLLSDTEFGGITSDDEIELNSECICALLPFPNCVNFSGEIVLDVPAGFGADYSDHITHIGVDVASLFSTIGVSFGDAIVVASGCNLLVTGDSSSDEYPLGVPGDITFNKTYYRLIARNDGLNVYGTAGTYYKLKILFNINIPNPIYAPEPI